MALINEECLQAVLLNWIDGGFDPDFTYCFEQAGPISRLDNIMAAWRIVPAIDELNRLILSSIGSGDLMLAAPADCDHIRYAISSIDFDRKSSSMATIKISQQQLSESGYDAVCELIHYYNSSGRLLYSAYEEPGVGEVGVSVAVTMGK
ncbi:hypothetical protein NBH81_03585 [Aeromonas veronii]|uniref:hypothetical protein n=1 Tax=Aeromonas veronii TaxID=654 RepID=UPI0021D835E3|nr:hypothetical protein [Aeromonas veronii]UYB71593.1 hypothetical protein NBH81_03585 [Aeromonas veronii]